VNQQKVPSKQETQHIYWKNTHTLF